MNKIRDLVFERLSSLNTLLASARECGYSDDAISEITSEIDQLHSFLSGKLVPIGTLREYLREEYSQTDNVTSRELIEKIYHVADDLANGI
jgi:hypothetical protein